MFKKLLLALLTLMASIGIAFAEVDVNKADQAALDSIKGIGPATSKAIIDARSKGGNFKDWADFESRVKGIGEKSAVKLSEAGLTINGQPKSGTAPKKTPATKAPAVSESKTDVTPEAKAKAMEVKPALATPATPAVNSKATTASKPVTNK